MPTPDLKKLAKECSKALKAVEEAEEEAASLTAECQVNNTKRAAAVAAFHAAVVELCDYADNNP